MAETVVGVFPTHERAIHGVEELRKAGFTAHQISIFAPDAREAEGYADELSVKVLQAGGAGIAAGGILGGLGGWLLGVMGLIVPGAGFVVAAGPIAAAIAGLVGGASLGGFVGLLAGLGLPEHAAEEYTRALRAGRTLVFVHADAEHARAELALQHASPIGIHRYDEKITASGG